MEAAKCCGHDDVGRLLAVVTTASTASSPASPSVAAQSSLNSSSVASLSQASTLSGVVNGEISKSRADAVAGFLELVGDLPAPMWDMLALETFIKKSLARVRLVRAAVCAVLWAVAPSPAIVGRSYDAVVWCPQYHAEPLLFGAAAGSIPLVELMLNSFHADINGLCMPVVCLDCDPIRPLWECADGHVIGKESCLMAAVLSEQVDMVRYLLGKGAIAGLQNEVCTMSLVCRPFAPGSSVLLLLLLLLLLCPCGCYVRAL